jgi:putative CocE/NonD family hydrolase
VRRCTVLGAAIAIAALVAAPAAHAGKIPQLPLPPASYQGMTVERNVAVPVSDGTKLLADLALPEGVGKKRLPTIVTLTPYGKNEFGANAEIVKRGFAQLIVDVRGTGASPGGWESFDKREQQDFVDVLKWVRQQAWSNRVLGTTGPSYMGINQLLVAERRPPGLKAIFPMVPAGDVYRDVVWHGGELDAGFIPLWMGLVEGIALTPPQTGDLGALYAWLTGRLTQTPNFPSQTISSALTGGDTAFDGPFYRLRSPLVHIKRVNVPTFVVGGWWDLFQRSEPTIYQRLRMKPGRKQLLMGPWYHATPFIGSGDVRLGNGRTQPQALVDLQILWFDRWLKGHRNGIDRPRRFGPVTLSKLPKLGWRRERKWPLPHRYRRLYLAPPSGPGGLAGSLKRRAPKTAGQVTIQPNPDSGVCSRTAIQWTAGLAPANPACGPDDSLAEQGAATFTTRPFKRRTEVAGPIALHMRGSTSGQDGFWVADITDVAPDGTSTHLTSGWLLMSRRALDRKRTIRARNGDITVPYHPFTRASLEPVTPGEPETLDVEIFNTDAVFGKGHRLRLVLRTSDTPHAAPTLPDLPNLEGAVQTVHLTKAKASYLSLPFRKHGAVHRRG